MLHGNVITPTSPTVGLSFLFLLLDVLKMIHQNEFSTKSMCIDIENFLNGSFLYKDIDRVGGIITYLRKVHRTILIERLGTNHPTLSEEYEQRLLQSELNNLYSSIFIISGSMSTGFSVSMRTNQE